MTCRNAPRLQQRKEFSVDFFVRHPVDNSFDAHPVLSLRKTRATGTAIAACTIVVVVVNCVTLGVVASRARVLRGRERNVVHGACIFKVTQNRGPKGVAIHFLFGSIPETQQFQNSLRMRQ